MRALARIFIVLSVVPTLWAIGTPARAQALDEVRLVSDGPDAVLQVRFNVRVQYQRHAPLDASDFLEIYFLILGGDEALTRPIEETLRVRGKDPAPGASVTYPVQTGLPVKKIVIRLDRKVEFRVRAGGSNQKLEIILPGLAPRAAQAPSAPPPLVERDRFAISLQTVPANEQGKLRAIPARLQDYAVFGSLSLRNGVSYYELVLGYFDSQAAAEQVLGSLQADFPQAKVFDVIQRKEENLQAAGQSPVPATPPMPVVGPAATLTGAAPGVAATGGTAAATAAGAAAAAAASGLAASGPTAASATAPAAGAAAAMVGAVPHASIAAGASAPPPVAPAPSPAPATAAASAAAAAAATPETELDKQGANLMAKSRAALIAGKNDEAINFLNQLLLLPPNKYSQDAQELVGVARERAGQLDQARKEYELYLRLFPTGDGATRVRQRLATMEPPEPAPTSAAKPPPEKRPSQVTAGGSLSQYYYGGDQKVQTVFNVPTTVNQQTISNSTQSSLVSTVDLNGRYRTDTNDTRIVVRDSDQYSFIQATAPSLNRLDAAYVDYRDLQHGLSMKLGRQSGVTGGLVGRFDGGIFSYDLAPKLRVNVVAGVPVSQDQYVNASQRFEGVNLEAQNLAEHWGGGAFLINQTADGVTDRRAVGGELRYFDQTKTVYSLVDYDVEFRTLNAATLQGTYQLPDQTSLSLLLDDRKAPTLETSNGLLQQGCSSYAQYFAGQCPQSRAPYTVDILRQDALATTANSHQIAFDVARPFGKSWQLSADLRVTSVGALPTVTINGQTFPGSSATGNVFGATLQATGSNLYSHRDINVFSATRLHSSTLDGDQLAYSNLNGLLEGRLTLEPNLSLYREVDTTGQRLYRVSPGFRTSYRLTQRMSFEGTVSMERTRNEGPSQNDTTTSVFYYLGYRYDLNY